MTIYVWVAQIRKNNARITLECAFPNNTHLSAQFALSFVLKRWFHGLCVCVCAWLCLLFLCNFFLFTRTTVSVRARARFFRFNLIFEQLFVFCVLCRQFAYQFTFLFLTAIQELQNVCCWYNSFSLSNIVRFRTFLTLTMFTIYIFFHWPRQIISIYFVEFYSRHFFALSSIFITFTVAIFEQILIAFFVLCRISLLILAFVCKHFISLFFTRKCRRINSCTWIASIFFPVDRVCKVNLFFFLYIMRLDTMKLLLINY